MTNTNDSILQAIDTIVSQRLNELNFDSTIVCEIISDTNKANGEYIVSNGDSRFTAYSNNVYIIGQKVYVTIPQNNFALKKIIVGPYTTDKTKVYELVMPLEKFIDVTGNLAADGRLAIETNSENENVSTSFVFDTDAQTATAFGEYKYFALRATVTTKMENEYQGDYGFYIRLYTNETNYQEFVFPSTEFYGNPYYYDEGFIVEKLFAYPAGYTFKKAEVYLYQAGNFTTAENSISASDFYLAFGYDQEDFGETSFKIALEGEQDFSYSLSRVSRNIKATLIKFFEETKSSKTLYVKDNEYSISWFRYKTGTPDLGGSKHWEKLFNPTEQGLNWITTTDNAKSPLEELLDWRKKLIAKNKENKLQQYIEENLDTGLNKLEEYFKEFFDEWNSSLTNEEALNLANKQIIEAISDIEQPIDETFTTGKYIGKYGDNQYRVIDFPYTNYQRDQLKAVATFDDKELVSNILTFEFTGTAPKDISDAETQSTLELSIPNNHLAYYPVYGENNSKIESYKGEGQTIVASFNDGSDINDIESFSWSVAPGGLVTLGAAATGEPQVNFTLPDTYVPSKAKTIIYCTVTTLNGEVITGSITITLGRYGSSGTDFTLSLVDENNRPASNFLKVDEAKIFKAYLVDSNNQPVELDGQGEKIKWEWVYEDKTSIEKTYIDGEGEEQTTIYKATLIKDLSENPGADVIQQTLVCEKEDFHDYCNAILKVTYKSFNVAEGHDVDLVCYHPIAVTDIEEDVTLTGAIEVLYDNNGHLIDCDGSKYSLKITDIEGNQSTFTPASNEQIILYKENDNVILPTLVPQTEGQGDDKKIISYNLSAIESIQLQSEIPYCSVTIKQMITNENDEEITYQWQQPIHIRYNTYGTELLNEWDGESLVVDKENNTIMASAYVAGTKNETNQFTGVIMGEVGKLIETTKESKQGIFGYKEGKQTFSIDEEGDAYFSGKVEVADYCKIDPDNGAFQVGRADTARMEIGTENIIEGLNVFIGTDFITDIANPERTINKGQFELQQGFAKIEGDEVTIEKERQANNLQRIGAFGANLYVNSSNATFTEFKVSAYRSGGGVNTTGADIGAWHNQVFKILYNEPFSAIFKENPTGEYLNEIFISETYPTGNTNSWRVTNRIVDKTNNTINVPEGQKDKYLIRHTQRCDVADYPPSLGGTHTETYSVTEGSESISGQRVVIQPNGYFNAVNGKFEWGILEKCTAINLNNTSASQTDSDQNLKNTISPLSMPYLNLLKSIQPVSYKYNNGTSDRLHTGFIAQQVEEALTANNLTSQDFAALVLDKNTGHYGLRYDEFIALNTLAIQDLYKYIELLEARIRELEKKESE